MARPRYQYERIKRMFEARGRMTVRDVVCATGFDSTHVHAIFSQLKHDGIITDTGQMQERWHIYALRSARAGMTNVAPAPYAVGYRWSLGKHIS